MFKKVVNLTPHSVNIVDPNGVKITFEPSGTIARLETQVDRGYTQVEIAPGVKLELPVTQFVSGSITGLPEPEEGTMFIVSYLIAANVKRADVFCPDTSEGSSIKDGLGNVIGVRSLKSYA